MDPNQPNLPKLGGLLSSGRGRLIALAAVIVLLVVLASYFWYRQKSQSQSEQAKKAPQAGVASPAAGVSPPTVLPITDQAKRQLIKDYFLQVSPNHFMDKFFSAIPSSAAEVFVNYQSATDSAKKLATARSFYILLNNPAADRSDPDFAPFVSDVRADLEKTIGQPLF